MPDAQRNRLMTRILSFPDLYNQYLDTLQAVANSAGDQSWMEQEVQREYAQVADAARADTQKPYTNADFENSILGLLNFARSRSAQVTAQVAASRK